MMEITEIEDLLKAFRWSTLQRMYGCAHSSIIGFISTEWINLSEVNSILDGAPAPITGNGRSGQKHADIILNKNNKPFALVEVETSVDKYSDKLDTISNYFGNNDYFNGIEFGLLFMTNLTTGEKIYQHCWDPIKLEVQEKNETIVLVSINKKKINPNNEDFNKLRRRNQYSP